LYVDFIFFFFQAEDGIRDRNVTGVQTCALPILTVACSPYLVAISTPSCTWVPSCSWVSTLPTSWSSAPRFARLTSSFSSAAIIRSEERRVGKECRTRWGADH